MKKTSAYWAEGIATFILVFIGAGSICVDAMTGQPGLLGIALAHGLALSIAVSATMGISGGHVNPAVSLAMALTKRLPWNRAFGYVVSQLAGATLAGLLLHIIFCAMPLSSDPNSYVASAAHLGTPNFDPLTLSPLMALGIEAVLTFLLVFAIFGTAVDPRAPKIGGFGIGLMVTADILVGGPLTGAAMNPARVFGTLVGGMSDTATFRSQHWVYWIGPVLGAYLAAWLYGKFILEKK